MIIIFILLLGIIITKAIYDLHKFNYNGQVRHIERLNRVVIQDSLRQKDPLIIHNVRIPTGDLTHETLISRNPGYIIQDRGKQILLGSLVDKDVRQISFYRNHGLAVDTGISSDLEAISSSFETSLSCGRKCFLSVMKGHNITQLSQNIHDILLLYQIQGHCSLYLINPKHTEDIQNKTSHQLKKWAHKIKLEPNLLVSIPPNWYYFYESKEPIIQSIIESDTYPTWIYNQFR